MKKYVVEPDFLKSLTDGESHYVSAQQLMKLYGVDRSECVITHKDDCNTIGMDLKGFTWLRPRRDGNYKKVVEGKMTEVRTVVSTVKAYVEEHKGIISEIPNPLVDKIEGGRYYKVKDLLIRIDSYGEDFTAMSLLMMKGRREMGAWTEYGEVVELGRWFKNEILPTLLEDWRQNFLNLFNEEEG